MDSRLTFDGWTCIWLSVVLLAIPLNWSLAVFAAIIFHELCHATAIVLSGSKILNLDATSSGIVMNVAPMNPLQELLCALAGPAGSFFLILFSRQFPELAFCGLMHGMYNMLPIYPLDGGRCLMCLCQIFLRKRDTDRICMHIQFVFLCFLCFAGIYLSIFLKNGILPIILCLGLAFRGFTGKFSCKETDHAVQ